MTWALAAPTLTTQTWNVTDQELAARLCYMLLENNNADAPNPAIPSTAMFTQTQWLNVLNQRQYKLLRDTSSILTRATEGSSPQVARYVLPDGVTGVAPIPPQWIHTRRLTWQQTNTPNPNGPIKSLSRTDTFALDTELLDWQINFADPTVYNDGSDLPTLTVELAQAPSQVGQMTLHYVALPTPFTGASVLASIPDELCEGVLWGALSDLLKADGESNDPERASFCETMYQLVSDLTNILIGGPPDPSGG